MVAPGRGGVYARIALTESILDCPPQMLFLLLALLML